MENHGAESRSQSLSFQAVAQALGFQQVFASEEGDSEAHACQEMGLREGDLEDKVRLQTQASLQSSQIILHMAGGCTHIARALDLRWDAHVNCSTLLWYTEKDTSSMSRGTTHPRVQATMTGRCLCLHPAAGSLVWAQQT